MTNSQTDSYVKGSDQSRFFLFQIAQSSRALVLLLALLLQIILLPLENSFPVISLLLQISIIFSAIFMVADSHLHLLTGIAFGVPASLILVFTTNQGYGTLTWISYALILLLYLHVIRLMLMQIFKARVVTLDTIALALCTYVLLGILWTLFYIPLAVLDPEAFVFNVVREGTPLRDSLHYFSFVTLTTLGYGDIVPVAPLARSLAILEALTGVLFMAVLISRLVGSYNSGRREEGADHQ